MLPVCQEYILFSNYPFSSPGLESVLGLGTKFLSQFLVKYSQKNSCVLTKTMKAIATSLLLKSGGQKWHGMPYMDFLQKASG